MDSRLAPLQHNRRERLSPKLAGLFAALAAAACTHGSVEPIVATDAATTVQGGQAGAPATGHTGPRTPCPGYTGASVVDDALLAADEDALAKLLSDEVGAPGAMCANMYFTRKVTAFPESLRCDARASARRHFEMDKMGKILGPPSGPPSPHGWQEFREFLVIEHLARKALQELLSDKAFCSWFNNAPSTPQLGIGHYSDDYWVVRTQAN